MRQQLTLMTLTTTASVLTLMAACSTQDVTDTEQPAPNITRLERLVTLEELSSASADSDDQNQDLAPFGKIRQKADRTNVADSAQTQGNGLSTAATAAQYILAKPRLMLQPEAYNPPALENTEKYQPQQNNPVVRVADQSTSTFSIDVDTGAYSNMRRMLNSGSLPPENAIRIEELLNYFNYDYEIPDNTTQPFSINTELSTNPWNDKTRLLHIGLKGYTIDASQRPPANLVFLIDVSGSMAERNKLGLLKSSITMLSKALSDQDSVSIVVYAGASGVVLEPTAGNESQTIARALSQLRAGGSTNGEAGIELAYAMAEKNQTENSINRIILATDGDFNVGISDIDKLKKLIERKRDTGIALTTLGFGSGNYNDHLMEQLANVGNGNYAYIDTLNEARKVLSEELSATLLTIAKDVKIQIEFNPAQVSEYRLLGYVNRALANEDFSNDSVDAGEIGAGHTVTALYEIALVGEGGERHSESRYQQNTLGDRLTGEIAEVRLRYKKPEESVSELVKKRINRENLNTDLRTTSDNYRFSAAVAGFAQLLRQSKYLDDFSYDDVTELATTAKGQDRFGYRSEFVQLVELANSLDQLRQVGLQTNDSQNANIDEG